MTNDVVKAVLAELEAAGIRGRVEIGGKHPYVLWVTPAGEVQRTICPGSPSDMRSALNQRAFVRRTLRDLGLLAADEPAVTQQAPVVLRDGGAKCTSLDIGRDFGKAHKDVLRVIDRVRSDIGGEFDRRNFAPISYVDEKGRSYRAYNLTRDGFVMVAMGFTGADAAQWKQRYIEAFNAMEAELASIAARQRMPDNAHLSAMRGDLDALTDIVLSLPAPRAAKRGPWVNPAHIYRQRRAERRARA